MNSNRIAPHPQAPAEQVREIAIYKHYLQISSRVYTELGVPDAVRELLDAFVISVPLGCKRDQEFALMDTELAMKITARRRSLDSSKRRIKRARQVLRQWQAEAQQPSLVLIRREFDPKTQTQCNLYRFPFMEIIWRVAEKCRPNGSDLWNRQVIEAEVRRFMGVNMKVTPLEDPKREATAEAELKRAAKHLIRGCHKEGVEEAVARFHRLLVLELLVGDEEFATEVATRLGIDVENIELS